VGGTTLETQLVFQRIYFDIPHSSTLGPAGMLSRKYV